MKRRVWGVTFVVLGFAALIVWQSQRSYRSEPNPLPPPSISRAGVDALPIQNPFGAAAALPKELPPETFAKMIVEFSEPGGDFMYDNYLSNERSYQYPIPALA